MEGEAGKTDTGRELGWDTGDRGHTPGIIFLALQRHEENGN